MTDPRLKNLYLTKLSELVQAMCAPFWWSVTEPENQQVRILHNGTICYVDTGSRHLGITADHVYRQYIADVAQYGPDAIECQFGSSTIDPEQRFIDRNRALDIATFDVPPVFVSSSTQRPKAHHHPVRWPPPHVQQNDPLIYGGYPGVLREEKGPIAELPFQWIAGRASDVTDLNAVLEPDFQTSEWLSTRTNSDPGGWSGGPVFRYIEQERIARLEIVGFIYDFYSEQVVLASSPW